MCSWAATQAQLHLWQGRRFQPVRPQVGILALVELHGGGKGRKERFTGKLVLRPFVVRTNGYDLPVQTLSSAYEARPRLIISSRA